MGQAGIQSPERDIGNKARCEQENIIPLQAFSIKLARFHQVSGLGPGGILGPCQGFKITDGELSLCQISHREFPNHHGMAKHLIILQQIPEERIGRAEVLHPNIRIS